MIFTWPLLYMYMLTEWTHILSFYKYLQCFLQVYIFAKDCQGINIHERISKWIPCIFSKVLYVNNEVVTLRIVIPAASYWEATEVLQVRLLILKAYLFSPDCSDRDGFTYSLQMYQIFWLRFIVSYSYYFTVSLHIYFWLYFSGFDLV